jgi:hypothetical protein
LSDVKCSYPSPKPFIGPQCWLFCFPNGPTYAGSIAEQATANNKPTNHITNVSLLIIVSPVFETVHYIIDFIANSSKYIIILTKSQQFIIKTLDNILTNKKY